MGVVTSGSMPPSGDVAGEDPWPGGDGAVPLTLLLDLRFLSVISGGAELGP